MLTFKQGRAEFKQFLESVRKDYELIGPTSNGIPRFEEIKEFEQINLEKNTLFPAKKFFFTPKQALFEFHKNKITVPVEKIPERVFFGLRKCDLNAIKHQDMVFINDSQDPYYSKRRDKSTLIGYHCNEAPSKWCFCESLDLVDYFDIMYYDKGDYFLVEVGSGKGQELVNKYKKLFEKGRLVTQNEKKIKNADRLSTKDISQFYDHPAWKEGSDICLSCSACTALCPTCYCFDIHDEIKSSDISKGERIREWSSCQVPEFSKVAGNHIFREKREERFKHRIYHQLDYFKEKYGVDMCVGCGRCIEGCPTRIDWVSIINKINDEKNKK